MKDSATNARHDGQEPQAPEKLVTTLKELPARRVFVPPSIDDAVLSVARRRLARRESRGFRMPGSWIVWPAMAVTCLVLIGLLYIGAPHGAKPGFVPEDVNRDGQVDILDAFQLARELQAGRKPAAGLDLNRDGVVDRRDAEVLAAHAVKLGNGGKS